MAKSNAPTLLIVDDEAPVRRSLERLLRKEGYEIFSAEDAESANQILSSDSIDVILCDQDMPGKNGTEFLLEAAEKYPHQRRLMISGRFQSDDVAVAMDAGAIHKFMMKPWDDAILKADIRASFRQLMADLISENRLGQEHAGGDVNLTLVPKKEPTSWAAFEEDRLLARELHSAASNGSLTLQYQPQIDLKSGTVCGLEALLRWEASVGPISPGRFIALAERTGAMTKLTHWVVCEVSHRARCWMDGWSRAQIGLNVSPVDLRDDQLVNYIELMLEQHDVPGEILQIEVTESQALNRDSTTLAMLNRLAKLGVSLAIDDFGAGATSLSYLADLPFTTLKLGRSLTEHLSNDKGIAVVQKVLEMTSCLGMKATIEGVETEEQVNLARELGADVAQGFFFSKPLARQTIQDWIAAGADGVPK